MSTELHEGETAKATNPHAGGGMPTPRLLMPDEAAIKLYREERDRRWRTILESNLTPRLTSGVFAASRSTT